MRAGDGGPLADIDPRGAELLWWHAYAESFEEELLPLVAQFNKSNECGITVVTENQGADFRDKMNAGVAAKDLPDLVVGDRTDQAFYAQGGGLVDLDLYQFDSTWGFSEAEVDDFFFLDQVLDPKSDGGRFGFPLSRSMDLLVYNQTWLEELGFDGPPASLEEFKEMACAAADENGDGTGGYLLRDGTSAVDAWTLAFGGNTLDETGVGYVFHSAFTLRAMNFLQEMVDEGCAWFLDEGFSDPEFAARRAIFAQASSSDLPYYTESVSELALDEGRDPDDWSVTAIPHTTADPVPITHGTDLMIPVTTPETELAAWIFLKWFTSPEIQAEWVRISHSLPTRAETTQLLDDYRDENPGWAAMLDLLPYGTSEPPLISYRAVRTLVEDAFNEIMQGAEIRPTLLSLTASANKLQADLREGIDLEDMDLPPVPVAEPCAPAVDGPLAGTDPREVQVDWWHFFRGDREDLIEDLIDEFNSTNDCGIHLAAERLRDPDALDERVFAAVTTGDLPGLVVGDRIDQAFYAREGALADMTPYVHDEYWGLGEEEDDFFSVPLEQGLHPAFDDQRLGFPLNRSMDLMLVNQTWMEELRFDELPTTPEEFREVACAAAEENDDGTGGYLLQVDGSALADWTMAFGGTVLDSDGTSYEYDSDPTVEALSFLKEMVDEGCAWILADESPNVEFAERRAILVQVPIADLPAYQAALESVAEEQERDPDELGMIAIPYTTDDPVQNIYGLDVMIPATTPETELAAWIFLKWFMSPGHRAEWVKIGDTLPTRKATVDLLEDYLEENAHWAAALDLLPFTSYEPSLISYRLVRDLTQDALEAIIQGEEIEETLVALTDEANDLQETLMEEED